MHVLLFQLDGKIPNLALMRILVQQAHLPLLFSNCIAILCCSMVNFCLGNNWTFQKRTQAMQG